MIGCEDLCGDELQDEYNNVLLFPVPCSVIVWKEREEQGVTTLTNAVSGQSQNCSGNRDTWKFFRETRDNSGTLQKKVLEFMSGILKISRKVTQKFGRMIQISGTTYVKTQ